MKYSFIAGSALVAACLAAAGASFAADHFDSVSNPLNVLEDKSHDIVDFFAFTAPDAPATDGAPGKLVLIMNSHSGSQLTTEFSNTLDYNFRLRTGAAIGAGNEYRITCTFDDPSLVDRTEAAIEAAPGAQWATCNTYQVDDGQATLIPTGTVNVVVGDPGGGNNPLIKIFAGLRADAFFGDAAGLLAMLQNHQFDFASRTSYPDVVRNPTAYANDMSIVLQIDTVGLFGNTPNYPANNTIFRAAVETARIPQ